MTVVAARHGTRHAASANGDLEVRVEADER
jgi:hypothetical protein